MRCPFEVIEAVIGHYEKTAPPLHAYLDDLYVRMAEKPDGVTWSEVTFALSLHDADGVRPAPWAANAHYKLMARLGRDTTGLAGY